MLEIASHTNPVGMTSTNHRNLYSFNVHVNSIDNNGEEVITKPLSFWISDVDPSEENMIPLVSNLNFYLTYYDALSPFVVIHPQISEKVVSQKTRYLIGQFPSVISAGKLDENLLSFWESAQSGSPFMKFLLYFRIIEYAAYHYIDETARSSIKRVLLKPELRNDVGGAIDAVVSALSATHKLHDSQRSRMTVRHCVKPAVLWPDVRDNIEFFSKPTHFDGGFSVAPIVSPKDTEETWGDHRLDHVSDALRKIRNALSHGKDQETTGVIRPTLENVNLFQPWVHLISAAAGEVVLYKDVT